MENPYSLTMPAHPYYEQPYNELEYAQPNKFKRRIDPHPTEPEYTTRGGNEPKEILTIKGKKKINFAVTQEGEILISSE